MDIFTTEAEARQRIEELKDKLRETDWVVVEILEFQLVGHTTPHDIDEIYDQRQEWRDEIEQLTTFITRL